MSVVDLYFYRATVIDRNPERDGDGVADGDSMTVNLDLGVKVGRESYPLRFALVDTPEKSGRHSKFWKAHMKEHKVPKRTVDMIARRAEAFIESCCPDGSDVLVRTHRDNTGKYGRLLAEVYAPTELVDVFAIVGLPDEKRPEFDHTEFQPLTIQANGVTWTNLNLELIMRGLALRAW